MSYIWVTLKVLIFFTYKHWHAYIYWRRKGVKGPSPLPIVGNYGLVLLRIKSEVDILRKIYNDYPNEKCIGIYIGMNPVLLIKDQNMIKQVLVKHTNKFMERFHSVTRYKKNLFVIADDERWAVMRKTLTPIFATSKLESMSLIINSSLNKYLKYLDKLVQNKATQNLFLLKVKYMQTISANLSFGLDYDETSQDRKNVEFSKIVNKLSVFQSLNVYRVLTSIPLVSKVLFHIININSRKCSVPFFNFFISLEHQQHANNIDTILNSLREIERKHETWKPRNSETLETKIDNEAVIQNAVVLFLAINSLITPQMVYMIYEIMLNQDVQQKCYEEITRVSKGGGITYNALSELKYMEMVLDETLRKYGSFMIERKCTAAYEFSNTGVSVDEGVYVIIPLDAIHKDAKFFSNPDLFDPERFSLENRTTMTHFIPFGDGPRSCFGKRLSKLVIMMTMARFLKKFQVLPSIHTNKIKESPLTRNRKIFTDVIVTLQKRSDP